MSFDSVSFGLVSKIENNIYPIPSCVWKLQEKKVIWFLGKSQTAIAYRVRLEVKSLFNASVTKDLKEEGL